MTDRDHSDLPSAGPEDEMPYALGERVDLGPDVVGYRAVRQSDGCTVLLHRRDRRPTRRDVLEIAEVESVLKRLEGAPVVAALGHEVLAGRAWLVLEDVRGQPLASVAAHHRAPARAIELAHTLALALSEVHRRDVVHSELTPHHVLVLDDGSIRLTGFRSATDAYVEVSSREFDGSLCYMAPEQTGRMARAVDSRTDLYALGVILYELVTGTRPFQATDALGWIHAHMARAPLPPEEIDERIPPSLGAIVLKLLAKDPDDRYQTARGLARDLERCATALSRGEAARFPLGSGDASRELRISKRLYGREREVALLIASFERARTGPSCVVSLVPGYSGIGKTSVVAALYQPVARERGRFIGGKFDQYKRDIPYATIAQAFRALMRDVLASSPGSLAEWRAQLHEALAGNAGALTDVIPEITTVLGPSPPIAQLAPREAQHRFEAAFFSFARVFARPDRPLVLFLDDMQWADDATLGLLPAMAAPAALPGLHLVLAYRDNEIGPGHPFEVSVAALHARGAIVESIPVRDLDPSDVLALVADTVKRGIDDPGVGELARALAAKAGGNPFFVGELLRELHRRALLAFDDSTAQWEWDERATDAVDAAGGIVELLVARLSSLTAETRRALGVAACFGNRFDLESLASVLDVSIETVSSALGSARHEGIVVAADGAQSLRFHHDRIQQAAYSLVGEDERAHTHLRIGRVLQREVSAGADDLLFDAVEHLNHASALLLDAGERAGLILLNLAAGRRAKGASAWAPARAYFEAAVSLSIGELSHSDGWATDRDVTFMAVQDLAQCEFLTGRFDRALGHFEDLRRRAASRAERAGVATLQIRLLIVSGRYDEAIELAGGELEAFDEVLPATEREISLAITDARRRLAHVDLRSMEALPPIDAPEPRALINLLASLPPAVYSRRPAALPLLAMKIVLLSLEHGNCEASCFGYSLYAMILAATDGEPLRALELSEASMALNERFQDPRLRAPAVHIHANHILCWSQPYDAAVPFLDSAYAAAIHVGDITIAAYVSFMGAWQEIERGRGLTEMRRALRRHETRAEASRHATARDVVQLQVQFARALAGETFAPSRLSDAALDSEASRNRIAAAGFDTGLVMHDALCAMLAWLSDDIAGAEAALERGAPSLATAYCLPVETTWALLDGLTAAALWDGAGEAERATLRARVCAAQARLEVWARGCPENFEAKHALVAAEAARLDGRTLDAHRGLERAYDAAQRTGMLHLQVIAAKLASRSALHEGLEEAARGWQRHEHDALSEWGATTLLAGLERRHPHLRRANVVPVHAGGTSADQLDVLAAIKASQALSRAIDVDDLARTLLRIVLEHAGAERAILFLARDGRLEVAADAGMDRDPSSALAFPQSIVSYVERTRSAIVLADIAADPPFSGDPYVTRSGSRSVLCAPVLVRAELAGVLYLENSLVAGAFSPDRVALLETVSTQLAISLDNARLHEERRARAAEDARLDATRSSDQRYREVLEAMGDGFFALDRDWRYTAVNRVQERISKRPREETLGRVLWDVDPGLRDPTRQFSTEYRRAMEERRPSRFMDYYAPLDLWVEVDAIPSADGGIAVFFRDVTDRARAEAQREELLARELAARQLAEASSRAKDEFLAMLGHELRNPLAPIVTALHVMRLSGSLGSERERAVIERQVSHLVRLVDDLLDVSRIAGGKLELSRQRVEIASAIASAIEATSPVLERGRHRVEIDVPKDGLLIDADLSRMSQVFSNLIANSGKYTPPGGRIVIRARREDDEVVVSVVDSGVGIPPDLLPHVFDLFVQNEQTVERAQGGLGLGLTIVKRLVALHGGSVEAHSDGAGRGSTFTVRLPVATSDAETAPRLELSGAARPTRQLRILIVDDNEDAAEVLALALEGIGHVPHVANDGPSALAALSTFHPDVALLDIGLPVMDGYELARRLRERPELTSLKLVAITGYGQESDRQRAVAAGFDHHLVKPVAFDALASLLDETVFAPLAAI